MLPNKYLGKHFTMIFVAACRLTKLRDLNYAVCRRTSLQISCVDFKILRKFLLFINAVMKVFCDDF